MESLAEGDAPQEIACRDRRGSPDVKVMSNPIIDVLESRRLFAAVYPTNVEQYEVELINRARANPTAEASRQGIDLNEGLAPGTISAAAKQPLAINPYVTVAARGHSDWMIANDTFAHNGPGSETPGDRMEDSGYDFTGNWTWGENIAYRSSRPGTPEPVSTATQLQSDLFIDSNVSGRGHRTNMMNNAFKEIGAGFSTGDFNGYNAMMLTTDFATSGSGSFLTGVAYSDTVTRDSFYTPGEGLGGIVVTATRAIDGATFSTTTWSSGGYSLKLTSGTYTVKASGAALGGDETYSNVVIGSENVKQDFTPGSGTTTPTAGTASVRGTVFNDLNRNGLLDAGEPGIPGVLVYIERNHDNRRNHDEKYARTNADGAYRLSGLEAATIRIQNTVPSGMTIIAPAANTYVVKFKAGQAVGGRSFADATAIGAAQVSESSIFPPATRSLGAELFSDALNA